MAAASMSMRPLGRLVVASVQKVHGSGIATRVSLARQVCTRRSIASIAGSLQLELPLSTLIPHTSATRQLSSSSKKNVNHRSKKAANDAFELEAAEAVKQAMAREREGAPGGESEIDDGAPEWEFDKPSEFSFTGENQEPTPILDAYERSRDPEEMERLIQMSFDALPPRGGPRRNNHKRRQHQKYRTIRNIKYKAKAQQQAAHERKVQKRRDRKKRENALFATWRGTDGTPVGDGTTSTNAANTAAGAR